MIQNFLIQIALLAVCLFPFTTVANENSCALEDF